MVHVLHLRDNAGFLCDKCGWIWCQRLQSTTMSFWLEQNMEYKFVELLSCQFQASSEEQIKQQVTYRYNAVKSRLALMQARLADINALVRH